LLPEAYTLCTTPYTHATYRHDQRYRTSLRTATHGVSRPQWRTGRRFGSLGLSLDELATTLTAYPAEQVSAEGPQSERVESFARQSLAAMGITDGTYIQVHQAIPDHAGLGSGTQLALAVGTALARL